MLKKYIIILVSTLFLFSCSSREHKKLQAEAQKVTDIIIESHDNSDIRIVTENEFLNDFFDRYPAPLSSRNKEIDNKSEELIQLLYLLNSLNSLYIKSKEYSLEYQVSEQQKEYSEILTKLNEEHNINIHE
ncbi:hypothetical protein ABET51_20190 [Metabacillus fastidiosus]|uniref:hypothetical protein n=1 Tax=Metabacillus fastidiosus TaxID=1458 RepID=UPI003D28AE9C